jgi:hypothetical protein
MAASMKVSSEILHHVVWYKLTEVLPSDSEDGGSKQV